MTVWIASQSDVFNFLVQGWKFNFRSAPQASKVKCSIHVLWKKIYILNIIISKTVDKYSKTWKSRENSLWQMTLFGSFPSCLIFCWYFLSLSVLRFRFGSSFADFGSIFSRVLVRLFRFGIFFSSTIAFCFLLICAFSHFFVSLLFGSALLTFAVFFLFELFLFKF